MQITPDFSEASESQAIPPGTYKTRITDVAMKKSQAGNDYLNWKLTIFGAEGQYSSQNNRPVFMMTMLSGKGAGKLRDLAKAALGNVPTQLETNEFLGKEVEVTLVERRMPDGSVSNFPDVKAVRSLR